MGEESVRGERDCIKCFLLMCWWGTGLHLGSNEDVFAGTALAYARAMKQHAMRVVNSKSADSQTDLVWLSQEIWWGVATTY